ncbi:prolipoprotein diacylglyceryl transferase [Salinibacillus xinjiangensis]|uniref:Phosphatidylglycerol--prolipoprotein diacylglyceryl transferase n=1 Tax=Salinibacillus xinjiangensis TaxID=1229268 RepID=A0A6G1X174_9BACI|nr:prolipoprotein diacylglyceryl transferase [Salinibacillus xinjiangensis]MRG84741.1 prolipoprotein diacylglyceryl transferase [Salinibacillus xinjiangensis]
MLFNIQPYDRVFIWIGDWPIYWYGVIIATGAALALWLATRESNRLGLKKDLFVDLLVFAIPAAILFARIYYVIFEWDRYAGGPWWKVFAVWEGGIAIHGALIGSVLTAYLFAKYQKVSFWQLADIAAPSLILGQAIGRWGNFMNQEAHGGEVTRQFLENLMIPDFIVNQMYIDGAYYHPTFLYESLWNILVLVFLLYLRRVNPRRGEIFFSYLISYSVGRFFVEGLRTDSLYVPGTEVRVAQLISILIIVVSIIIMTYRRKKGYADKRYNGKKVIS